MTRMRPIVAAAAVASLTALGVVGLPSVASASGHYCHGHKATIVGHGKVNGTKKADVIVLTGPSVSSRRCSSRRPGARSSPPLTT